MPKEEIKKEKRYLILAVDIDNDLYRKAKIQGPVIGRVQNLNAATQLALADPEEADANTMFYAVNLYDKLKEEGYMVNVATVTGAETEGFEASSEVAKQLDEVLKEYKADACIFVSDGASDNRVLPIVESRIPIDDVEEVRIKQAEGLENTYFTIMEKLKEPHYARIVFGIPGIILLLFALSYLLTIGFSWWAFPVALISLYFIYKGFGFEEKMILSFRDFSLEKPSFLFFVLSLLFFIIALLVGYNTYLYELYYHSKLISFAYGIEGFLIILPTALILYLVGKIIEVRHSNYMFRGFNYGMYVGYAIGVWFILYTFAAWIIGQIYFSTFLLYTIIGLLIGIASYYISNSIKKKVVSKHNVKDKLLLNELGANIGKVLGFDKKRKKIIVQTNFGSKISYPVERIIEITSDKVVIK